MLTKKQIEELLAATEEILAALEANKEECDKGTCQCDDGTEDVSDECYTTPIEECITIFINKCVAEGRLPTLEEAHSIKILDEINSKYN